MREKILIVDDSEMVRELIKFILMHSGFDVIEAQNGYDALNVLDDQKVDLILTDIKMPVMNGLDLINLMKYRPEYGNIPIIVISSEADSSHAEERKRVLAWIQKPFKTTMLLHHVNTGLNLA